MSKENFILIEKLNKKINRNNELLKIYESIEILEETNLLIKQLAQTIFNIGV